MSWTKNPSNILKREHHGEDFDQAESNRTRSLRSVLEDASSGIPPNTTKKLEHISPQRLWEYPIEVKEIK